MPKTETKREWLLLIHQLPQQPTSLRVRTWRKLQKLGAVSVKNSVYVLPFDEKTHEDFQWLTQEIEAAAGSAAVFRAGSVEGATDVEIIGSFRQARDEEYAKLTAELDGLTGAVREQKRGGHLSPGRLSSYEAELDKLHAELERISSTDFFDAKGRTAAQAAYERCQKALRAAQSRDRARRLHSEDAARVRSTRHHHTGDARRGRTRAAPNGRADSRRGGGGAADHPRKQSSSRVRPPAYVYWARQ